MKYQIIVVLLSIIIVSSITFDDAFAIQYKQNEHPLINQHSIDIQNTTTIIIFNEKSYTQEDTLTLTCADKHAGVAGVKWFIKNTDNGKITASMQSQTYSFLGSELEVGDYSIKCRIGFGDSHRSHSEWVSFSIINEIIVDLAAHPQTINYVDMIFNSTAKDLTIFWNFGINPDRESCNSKTEFYQSNYTNITPLTFDLNRDYLNFEGYHTDTLNDGSLGIINTDLTNSEIDCQGSITINTETIHPSNYTDEFSLYMTFFEVISPDKRNDSKYEDDIRPDGIIILNEANFITSSIIDIQELQCGNLNPSTDTWRFVELVHDITGSTLTTFATVDACFTDSSQIPPSIPQTIDEKKNGSGGCSGDCTAPTMGVDKNGVRFVDDGLKLNGVSFDSNYFKNHMPMQYTEIGKINHLSLKVYENSGIYNIKKIQFGIVKEIGSPINLAEPRIEIDVSNFANDIENASLEGFTLMDKEEIIDYHDVSVSIVPCMDQSTQECLKLDIYWSFVKVPEFNVLLINGWDNNKNSFNNYFNDGLTTIDPNYVEPIPEEPYKYVCNDKPLHEIMNGGDRNNCHWRALQMEWLYK